MAAREVPARPQPERADATVRIPVQRRPPPPRVPPPVRHERTPGRRPPPPRADRRPGNLDTSHGASAGGAAPATAERRRHRSRPPEPPAAAGTSTHFRPDIQGLRAVAVGLVVLNHVTGWPGGGYIGVDVFFVISGFLITGLLIRERERNGRISFRGFYVRRARRILPAAVVVLAVTSAASWLLFLGDRAHQIVVDGLWSLAFAANVHFAQRGTDYFAAGTAHSPVQHFWSLSVEEQFYLVWPVLLLVVSALVVGARRQVALGTAMFAVCAASFWWSMHATADSPATAYFSTFTRAWELGVGALVAVAAAGLHRLPATARALGAWAGLAGILIAAFAYSPATAFPGTAAALPVLSAAALVAFGNAPGGPGGAWVLAARPMRFLGDISYSLYLWHWPIVVLLGVVMGSGTTEFYLAALTVSLLLATLSYLTIEEPVLASGWLLRNKPDRDDPHRRSVLRRARSVALLTASAGVAAYAYVAVILPDDRPRTPIAVPPAGAAPLEATVAGQATVPAYVDPLPDEIRASLQTAEWGPLEPALDDLSSSKAPEWQTDKCLDVDASNMGRCVYGDPAAPQRAVVLGDSIAASWMPGLRAALPVAEWSIQLMTWHECPNITAPVRGYAERKVLTSCAEHRDWALNQIAANPPDLVILSNNYGAPLVDSKADVATTWRTGAEEIIGRLHTTGARIIVLAAPPTSVALEDCATALNSPSDCVAPLSDGYEAHTGVERGATESVGATFIDTRHWFCFQAQCPAVVGTTPVYVDELHLTAEYSRKLTPQLSHAILGRW